MKQAIDGVKENDFTPRQWALDNRKLYNHGDFTDGKGTNLF